MAITSEMAPGPDPVYNQTVTTKPIIKRTPQFLGGFKKKDSASILIKDSKGIVICTSFTPVQLLLHNKFERTFTFLSSPGTAIQITIKLHQALLGKEYHTVTRPILVSPLVIHETEAAAKAQREKIAAERASRNERIVEKEQQEKVKNINQAAYEAQKEMQKKVQVSDNKMYVMTKEELQMFWPITVVQQIIAKCNNVIQLCKSKQLPLPDGIEEMLRVMEEKQSVIIEKASTDQWTPEMYLNMVKSALDREQKRNIPYHK